MIYVSKVNVTKIQTPRGPYRSREVMDAFQILTRSTTLSRKASNTAAAHPIPSTGEASNAQLYGANITQSVVSDLGAADGSRKRKRGGEAFLNASGLPEVPNFFDDHSKTSSHDGGQERRSKIQNKKEGPNIVGIDVNGTSDSGSRSLGEEECRKLLKSHKIKITKLLSADSHGDGTTDGQRRKHKRGGVDEVASETRKKKKRRLEIIPQPLTSFAQLRSRYGISRRLAENIEDQGYALPTEVQLGSLPLLLGAPATTHLVNGKQSRSKGERDIEANLQSGLNIDLLTVAPTGSGKTLAFLIPVLNAILQQRTRPDQRRDRKRREKIFTGPQAVIVAPTKELASQIVNEGRKLSLKTGVKVTLVRKGMDLACSEAHIEPTQDNSVSGDEDGEHIHEVESSVKAHILVCTPLTMLHAMTAMHGSINTLPTIQYLILDEADVLLDPLFREQTLSIWSACTNSGLRVSLWSATMGSSIEDLAKSTIEEHYRKFSMPDSEDCTRPDLVRLVVGLKDSAIPSIAHKLVYAASEQGKLMALRQLLHPSSTLFDDGPVLRPPFLIFTQTIPRAVALHSELLYDIPQEAGGSSRIAVLHSDLSDTARDHVMTRFRKGDIWVLITTDLLSRGVDFKGINGVVNFDFPNSSAAYVHRVGRTGRAGRQGGVAVTLYTKEDIPYVKNVANVIAESQRGAKADGDGMQQWLSKSLPKPSKRDKQQLKKGGVESRRANKNNKEERNPGGGKTRISTKSGFVRRIENNRKGAMNGSRLRAAGHERLKEDAEAEARNGADFQGFED